MDDLTLLEDLLDIEYSRDQVLQMTAQQTGSFQKPSGEFEIDTLAGAKLAVDILKDHGYRVDQEYPQLENELTTYIVKYSKRVSESLEDEPTDSAAIELGKLVKDEYEAVEGYKVAAEKFPELADQLNDIAEEEYVHVGELETLLKSIDASAESIEDGAEEVEGEDMTEEFIIDEDLLNQLHEEDEEPHGDCPTCHKKLTFTGYQGNDEEFKCPDCKKYFYRIGGRGSILTSDQFDAHYKERP